MRLRLRLRLLRMTLRKTKLEYYGEMFSGFAWCRHGINKISPIVECLSGLLQMKKQFCPLDVIITLRSLDSAVLENTLRPTQVTLINPTIKQPDRAVCRIYEYSGREEFDNYMTNRGSFRSISPREVQLHRGFRQPSCAMEPKTNCVSQRILVAWTKRKHCNSTLFLFKTRWRSISYAAVSCIVNACKDFWGARIEIPFSGANLPALRLQFSPRSGQFCPLLGPLQICPDLDWKINEGHKNRNNAFNFIY